MFISAWEFDLQNRECISFKRVKESESVWQYDHLYRESERVSRIGDVEFEKEQDRGRECGLAKTFIGLEKSKLFGFER